MTLPTSSLFPLTTLLPLLAFAPLFSRKSAVKMVSTDGFTARLLLHIQRESWSTRLIFLIRCVFYLGDVMNHVLHISSRCDAMSLANFEKETLAAKMKQHENWG
ncbi:uncharacterized protein LOC128034969 isoform X3 [Gossypium raimondii]|uniref:uncharacterized protein LOC128034969 isoform X3 n=1 Tax=Gossypium raimondii TaxID=29730 RepID=UPI00227CF419|nr:uncharacterized protein LOC128034969 isoform X3 [Gossypium raimondii]